MKLAYSILQGSPGSLSTLCSQPRSDLRGLMNSSLPLSHPLQNPASEPESDIAQKQRGELQPLTAWLKDRDKLLDSMVAIHPKQVLAWKDDRQKILTLLIKSVPKGEEGP